MKKTGIILLLAIAFCFAACKNPAPNQQQKSDAEVNEKTVESEIISISVAEKNLEEYEPQLNPEVESPIANQNPSQTNQKIQADFTRQPKEEKILPGNKVAPFALLHSGFAQPSQTFTLDSQTDTTFTCEQGTIVSVNAGSFVYAHSGMPAKGDINFTVQEYYRLSDMLLAGLTTTSNGEILETGGMIYLDATSGGEPLALRNGAEIRLEFPYEEKKEGMQLFSGTWNDHGINWELMEDPFEDEETTMIFEEVDDLAEFPGGVEAIMRYINRNIRYPGEALELGKEGLVIAEFVITETGDVIDVTILRSVHSSIDKEVVRALEAMPRWTPARRDNKNIASREVIGIKFFLGGDRGNFETSEADIEPLNEDNLEDATIGDIQRYIFTTGRLGWINVDVFILNRTPLRNLAVRVEDNIDIRLIFVLEDFNSLIGGYREDDRYIFRNVPQGLSAKLISIKHENGQYHLAIDPSVTLSTAMAPRLNYQPVTMEGLQKAMEIINN